MAEPDDIKKDIREAKRQLEEAAKKAAPVSAAWAMRSGLRAEAASSSLEL